MTPILSVLFPSLAILSEKDFFCAICRLLKSSADGDFHSKLFEQDLHLFESRDTSRFTT